MEKQEYNNGPFIAKGESGPEYNEDVLNEELEDYRRYCIEKKWPTEMEDFNSMSAEDLFIKYLVNFPNWSYKIRLFSGGSEVGTDFSGLSEKTGKMFKEFSNLCHELGYDMDELADHPNGKLTPEIVAKLRTLYIRMRQLGYDRISLTSL